MARHAPTAEAADKSSVRNPSPPAPLPRASGRGETPLKGGYTGPPLRLSPAPRAGYLVRSFPGAYAPTFLSPAFGGLERHGVRCSTHNVIPAKAGIQKGLLDPASSAGRLENPCIDPSAEPQDDRLPWSLLKHDTSCLGHSPSHDRRPQSSRGDSRIVLRPMC